PAAVPHTPQPSQPAAVARVVVQHAGAVRSVAFSPNGARLITGSDDGSARIWHAGTGELLLSFEHEAHICSVAINPDGARLATAGSDCTAHVWNTTTGAHLWGFYHSKPVNAVAWAADGVRLATASTDGTARIWDTTTGTLLVTMNHSSPVLAVAWTADGARLATGSADRTARIWNARSGAEVGSLLHARAVSAVAFSRDGSGLLTGCADASAHIWLTATGGELLRATVDGWLNEMTCVGFSPDGARLALGSLGAVQIRDAFTFQELLAFGAHGASAAKPVGLGPPAGQRASGAAKTTVWDNSTGVQRLSVRHKGGMLSFVNSVAFSPDGTRLATGGDDNVAVVWSLTGV
ncbi:hypothetical protein JF66_19840, partial [Cryobacterium sp. MLB-32]|uniref:WD40 repeat domain-containing protein n=1 Tax=Cryobacterium sp. MLB-32 TaxID=1529318 RepID=UPI0004E6AE41